MLGWLQPRQNFDLIQKAFCKFRRIPQIRQEHFHRIAAIGNEVADFVDAAHPASADYIHYLVVTDSLTCTQVSLPSYYFAISATQPI